MTISVGLHFNEFVLEKLSLNILATKRRSIVVLIDWSLGDERVMCIHSFIHSKLIYGQSLSARERVRKQTVSCLMMVSKSPWLITYGRILKISSGLSSTKGALFQQVKRWKRKKWKPWWQVRKTPMAASTMKVHPGHTWGISSFALVGLWGLFLNLFSSSLSILKLFIVNPLHSSKDIILWGSQNIYMHIDK